MKTILSLLILFVCSFSSSYSEEQKPTVLVSLAPYKFFIDQISGDTVNVQMLVPANANAHAYEPSPKQMIAASKAKAWFILGEAFEKRAIPVIQSSNPSLLLVDLRNNVSLIRGSCCQGHHHHESADLHIWLSPTLAKIQSQTIAEGLIKILPENETLYRNNLQKLLSDLDALDLEINEILKDPRHRTILVAHPSFAYFCRDYGLEQLSIEFEGKDPTPRQLTETIEKVRQLKIDTIFVQRQFSTKGATIVAKQLGAKIVEVDPYSPEYFTMMRELAKQFAE